jgi:cyanophycinase
MFLIGGGRDPEGVRVSHTPFLEAVGGEVLCVCLDDPERWVQQLAGANVKCASAPVPADLDGVSGVYVAGGLTPAYWATVCTTRFGDALREWGGVYAGFSAGAALAAGAALVGGWRLNGVDVCDSDFAEGLEEVEVRPGLGLVDFTVDVHASQWGTLTRLAHAVAAGMVSDGLAIDEHTCVEVRGDELRLHGWGGAYRLGPGTLEVLRPEKS